MERMRSFLAQGLVLGVLAVSTAALVAHDVGENHDPRDAAEGVECALDHEHGSTDTSAPVVESAGAPHWHFCFSCQATGQRVVAEALRASSETPSVARGSTPERTSSLRSRSPWTGRTLRGPPSA